MDNSDSMDGTASGETLQARVLCLDPGASMGWATLDDLGETKSGVVQHKGDLDSRLGSFYTWLRQHIPSFAVVMERPQGLRGAAVESQIGMIGIARALCETNRIAFVPVSPASVKKAALGRGHCAGKRKITKQDVMDWAEAKHGRPFVSDEADALALLEYWKGIE